MTEKNVVWTLHPRRNFLDPLSWADPKVVTVGLDPPPPPQKITKNIGFLCNTCPDYLKNHKATKPAFNVGPSSARQRNAISMAFRWRADDVPFKAEFGSSPPPPQLKKNQIWTPPPPPSDKTFWNRVWPMTSVGAWWGVMYEFIAKNSLLVHKDKIYTQKYWIPHLS